MTKILIVDDMAIFREPVAATLRQEGFETLTAVNGQEALSLAAEENPDLILLDAAMPVMDGLTCAQHLRQNERLRAIPIIMLTAITDRTVVQDAVAAGVRDYLLKSHFTTPELLNRIRRTLAESPRATRERTDQASGASASGASASVLSCAPQSANVATSGPVPLSADRTLARIREFSQLRSIKPVLQHVLSLTRSARSSFEEIAGAIRQDQALAMKVMKVANSSFYLTSRSATTLRDAEQRIGLSGIRNLTTAILAIEQFADVNPAGIVPQRYWEHSLATGMLAQRIAETAEVPKAEDLFLAGLLHDVGRLVLSDVFPEHYAHVMHRLQEEPVDLCDLEREQFQLTHADITREVLMHWKLPAHVVEAAVLHHSTPAQIRQGAKLPSAALALVLANRLSHALMLGDSGSETIHRLGEVVSALGISQRALSMLAEEAVKKIVDVTLFYGAHSQTRTLKPLADVLRGEPPIAPRVWLTAAPPDALQPVLLMLGQLGWINHEAPNVALVGGDEIDEVNRQLRNVKSIEERAHRSLPVVWISTECHEPEKLMCAQVKHLILPCRRTIVLAALREAAMPRVRQ